MSTAKTYAGCQCVVTPEVLSARHARSDKVLHHNTTGGVVILIDSKVPRKWRAAVARADGSPWKGDANFNSASMGSYHTAQFGKSVNRPLAEPYESTFTGLPKPYEYAKHQYALSKMPAVGTGEFLTPFTITETPKKEFEGYTPRAKAAPASTDEFHAPTPNPDSHWYESERDARLLKDFVALRLAGHTTNLMIVGPSGFGKTQGIIRFGKAQGVPVHVINCQAITTPEKWIGQMQVSAEKGTYFDVANHIKWVERTHEDCDSEYCIMLYDEMTRLRPELANMQFSLLDDQQGLEVPQMGRRVNMNPKNVVIATANIGAPYAGTFTMDWALRGRFDMNLERNFPPADEEIKILTSAFDKLSDEDAASLVRVADHTRTLWQNGELESPISTRSLASWARLIAGGYSIKDAAEYTIIPLYNEDGGEQSDRAKVKLAVDGKVAR